MRKESKIKNQEVRMKDFEVNQEGKKRRREEKRKRKEEGRDEEEPASKALIVEEDNTGKRKAESPEVVDTDKDGDVNINQIIMDWVHEVNSAAIEEEEEEEVGAWDDVHGGTLPQGKVEEARKEEIGFMQGRNICSLKPIEDCWRDTGKAPVSVRWVDTNKGGNGEILIRSRLVARDFKGKDNDRNDLFAGTPPLEAKKMLFSRAVTRRKDRTFRKLLFIDARKAHLNPKCEENVYVELP